VEERATVVFRSIDSLRRAPAEAGAGTRSTPGDPAQLRKRLERLQAALAESDPGETEQALAALGEAPTPEMATDLRRIRSLADGYEFDEAAAVLASLLERI
jgi:hypothetical protein